MVTVASAAPIRSSTDPVRENVCCVPAVSTPDQRSVPVVVCFASIQHGPVTDTTTVYDVDVDDTGTVAWYKVAAVGTTVLSAGRIAWLRER
jgi:hypothetical protein